ncbi:MAG: glycosyltransferase family 4 protein [Ignavibacteria bacterium]|nr:glycosyltransferase family 4 protein [Ignavibacteria bacterium]
MRISELTQQVDPSGIRRVLLVPFEDQELPQLIHQAFPDASVTVLGKHDLAGLSVLKLIRRLRSDRWDIAVASVYQPAVHRSQISVELLITLSGARDRFVRVESDSLAHVTWSRFAFFLLPYLFIGSLLGLGVVISNYISVLLLARKTGYPRSQRPIPHLRDRKTVLFLRGDVSGAVHAGGSASHVKGMVKAFVQSGFNVVYVADSRLRDLPSAVTQIQIKPLKILEFFDEFQLLHYNLRIMRRLGEMLRDYQPSLIYQRHAIFTFAGSAMAHRFQIPIVLEANDSEVWIKRHWSRLMLDDLATRCEALALDMADRVAVISEGVKDQLSRYRIERARFILNPNGVDPDEFHPDIDGATVRQRYQISENIVVGFIGTFTRWHGVETLFDAALRAVERDSNLRFLFIGEGDLRSALEHRTAELGLQKVFIFTGLVPHSEAPHYLAACDVLVSPHLGFQDGTNFFGSPTKLFEYMAMGKPIIASRLGQIGEVIVDGVNGLHMNPGDTEQLAELILKLAHEKELRTKLGRQARADVVERHTWRANVERIVKSFETSSS